LVVIPEGDLLLPLPLLVPAVVVIVPAVVVVLVAVVSLVVIPEGDLLLPLLLFLSLPLSVLAVILSAAKDPGTLRTTHTARTFQPETRLQDPPIPVPSPKSN
jgi:membrane protein implicated in regulation of membrane protease activity